MKISLAPWVIAVGIGVCRSVLAAEPAAPDTAALEAKGLTFSRGADGLVTGIDGDWSRLSREDFVQISGFKAITRLSMAKADSLTDDSFALLDGLDRVRLLQIDGGRLTDEGFRHFGRFPNLDTLALFHTSRGVEGFTGKGIEHLRTLPQLKNLTFAGSLAGDEAFEAIARLEKLEALRVWHNAESAGGLEMVGQLRRLKFLTIGQRLPQRGRDMPPSFTGRTLDRLAAMTGLERLELMEARLTREDLVKLKKLPVLKMISIKTSIISEADVAAARAALAGIEIRFQPAEVADEKKLAERFGI